MPLAERRGREREKKRSDHQPHQLDRPARCVVCARTFNVRLRTRTSRACSLPSSSAGVKPTRYASAPGARSVLLPLWSEGSGQDDVVAARAAGRALVRPPACPGISRSESAAGNVPAAGRGATARQLREPLDGVERGFLLETWVLHKLRRRRTEGWPAARTAAQAFFRELSSGKVLR